MRFLPQLVFAILVVAVRAGAESDSRSDDGAATHLDHLAFALEDLESDKSEVRRIAIGRLVFYRGDSVSDGILVEHWFAEPDSANRVEILRGLLRNGTLSRDRIVLFRNGAARFAAHERDVRLKELADLSPTSP